MNSEELLQLEADIASGKMPEWTPTAIEVFEAGLKAVAAKATPSIDPFVAFYEDVISNSLRIDFQSILGTDQYKVAQDNAKSCLSNTVEFRNLLATDVIGWLVDALHFTDVFVLHYVLNQIGSPIKIANYGKERSRYHQLIGVGGTVAKLGWKLDDLYERRNSESAHRTRETMVGSGVFIITRPKRWQVRKVVISKFPAILKLILTIFKGLYPTHIQS